MNTSVATATPLIPEPAKVKASTGVSLSISSSGVASKATAPVDIPKDAKWGEQRTAVQAKDSALIRNTGEKAVATYVVTNARAKGDGDNIVGTDKNGRKVDCRIDNIDTPETAKARKNQPDQDYGQEAAKVLQRLVDNKEVTIRVVTGIDKYGRDLCQVEVEGKDVGRLMAQGGAAWGFDKFGVFTDPMTKVLQDQAKANKEGLWANPNAEHPRVFKARYNR